MTKKERLAYWQGVINQYNDSGLSGADFCREHNINPGRFYHWRRRLQDDGLQESGGFFELVPYPPADSGRPIRVCLTNGIIIEVGCGFDAATLCGVIETVGSIRPCSR